MLRTAATKWRGERLATCIRGTPARTALAVLIFSWNGPRKPAHYSTK